MTCSIDQSRQWIFYILLDELVSWIVWQYHDHDVLYGTVTRKNAEVHNIKLTNVAADSNLMRLI